MWVLGDYNYNKGGGEEQLIINLMMIALFLSIVLFSWLYSIVYKLKESNGCNFRMCVITLVVGD